MKKQFTAILLLLGMLLTSAACASDAGSSSGADTTSAASSDAVTSADSSDPYADEIGAYDFDGDEFHSYTRDKTTFNDNINIAEETGDVLNDAIYRRNRTIEERFNMVFAETMEENTTDKGRTAVLAGDDTYDIIQTRCVYAYNYAAEGLLLPITDLPVIDLEKAYWDEQLTNEMTILGRKYFAVGSYNLTSYDFTHIIVFNKDMAADYNLGNMYQIVKDGSWTLEKYEEMGTTVTSDINGDGTMDVNDRYGYLCAYKQVLPNFWISAGITSVEKDADDKPVFSITSDEKFFNLVEEIFKVHYDTGMWLMTTFSADIPPENLEMFSNNQALFTDCSCYAVTTLRATETDFGIIPYPKYDESQEQYYSRIEGCELVCIPVTNKSHDLTGVTLEAMACESAKTVIPAYYDLSLQGKITRDEESAEMLDLIFDTRVFDWGDTIWCVEIRDGIFKEMMKNNDRDLASKTAALDALVQDKIRTTVETFEKLS